jgi:hypothetical protein
MAARHKSNSHSLPRHKEKFTEREKESTTMRYRAREINPSE